MALNNFEILRNVFEYLNGIQLSNASQVCRVWNFVAASVKKKRGPFVCTTSREETDPPQPWIIIKRIIIDNCKVHPMLNFFFIATGCEIKVEDECHCKYLPPMCYTVSLETFFPIENANMIKSMFFPKASNLYMSTISLNEHSQENAIYCKELHFYFDVAITQENLLRHLYDSILSLDSQHSVCMIYFCDQISIKLSEDVFRLLEKWYPQKRINVWGGMLHQLTICDNYPPVRSCQNLMNAISIVLGGKNMESWLLTLGPYHKTDNRIIYRFRMFAKSVKLKKHSVAFMFTSDTRGEKYYYQEAETFLAYFPGLELVKIVGISAISGENMKNVYTKLQDNNRFLKGKETSFLIISYDN